MTSVLDMYNFVQQQGDRGLNNRFETLAGKAYNAPREQRQNLLSQAAMINPAGAMQMGGAMQGQDDAKMKRMANMAMYLAKAPEAARPAIYRQIVPELQQTFPGEYPGEYTPEVGQMAESIVQAFGGGAEQDQGMKSLSVGGNGNFYAIKGGELVDTGVKASESYRPIETEGGYQAFGSRSGTAKPLMSGGQSAPTQAPPPGTNDRLMEIANAMAQAGMPDAQIEAWLSQQPGIGAPQAQPPQGHQLQPKAPQITPAQQAQLDLSRQANARAEEDARRRALGTPLPGQRFDEAGNLVDIPGAKQTGQAAKPPTDGEKLSAGFLLRMKDASQGLSDVVANGYTPGGVADFYTAGAGPMLNWAASEKGQVYRQQQEDWVRAKLRKESGAAIPAEEMDREIKTYFPQPGDSKSVIESKAKSRATALRAMEIAAGKAAALTGGNQPQAPSNGGWSIQKVE